MKNITNTTIATVFNKLNSNADKELEQNKNLINHDLQAALTTSKALVRQDAQTYWAEVLIPKVKEALRNGQDNVYFYPNRGSLGEKYIKNSIFLFELVKLTHVNGMYLDLWGHNGTLSIRFDSNIIHTCFSKFQIMIGSSLDCRYDPKF